MASRQKRTRRNSQAGVTLIELLVILIIMSIVSTMILTSWFALSKSYVFTVNADSARDSGRQAISHMERDIRDMESPDTGASGGAVALKYARPYWIAFYSTFNNAGNTAPGAQPHLVVYRLYSDGEIWRFEDQPKAGVYDGVLDNVDLSPPGVDTYDDTDITKYNLSEQTNGEGRMLMARDISNLTAVPGDPQELFQYYYYDGSGVLQKANERIGDVDRQGAQTVEIHLLIDLNPEMAPVYANLKVAAQLRNQRGL